jgi:hypothetical protein
VRRAIRKLGMLLSLATTVAGVGSMTPSAAQARVVAARRNVYVAPRRNVYVAAPAYHPVARTAAVVGTAAVTAAVVGSVVHSLPPQCTTTMVGNVAYQQCGSTWYQPRYSGSEVTYVVVNPPR